MTNRLYTAGREGLLDGSIQWLDDDIRACLVSAAYFFNEDDKYMAALGEADNGRSDALNYKSALGGVADAADATLTATRTVTCDSIVLFKHTGDDASARLLLYLGAPITGLPFTPVNGQIVKIEWDNGENRIFRL